MYSKAKISGVAAALAFVLATPAIAAPKNAPQPAPTAKSASKASSSTSPVTTDARHMVNWVRESADNKGRPFVVVDKNAAMVFVYAAGGQLIGQSPALLGLAPGDHGTPGIGKRPQSQMLPEELTTPAGRFDSEPGRNLEGEDIIWFNYDEGLAIHRLRPGASYAARLRRLNSLTPKDNRASLGCVVVSAAFYDDVIKPTLSKRRGVVYVLPETRPLQDVLQALQ